MASICCSPPERLVPGSRAPLAEDGEEAVHARERPGPGPAAVGADLEVLLTERLGKIFRPSGTSTMPRPTSVSAGRPLTGRPANSTAPREAGHRARQRPEQRGLAGAVGADHRHQLALGHVQGDAEERLEVAVARGQVADGEQGHATSIPR